MVLVHQNRSSSYELLKLLIILLLIILFVRHSLTIIHLRFLYLDTAVTSHSSIAISEPRSSDLCWFLSSVPPGRSLLGFTTVPGAASFGGIIFTLGFHYDVASICYTEIALVIKSFLKLRSLSAVNDLSESPTTLLPPQRFLILGLREVSQTVPSGDPWYLIFNLGFFI